MRSKSFEVNNSHTVILVDASQICKWTYNLAMTYMKADVRIFENLNSLSQAAAELFIETSAQATLQRGRCLVTLSGGLTPTESYKLLAQSPDKEQIDWSRFHVFWGDERCVPIEDLESNYRQAHGALLSLLRPQKIMLTS
jgi:6-phosphogluconolactonase/glucosamine-6-phosphate isomerase/deaminase